jgi:hypothetical protein
MAAAVRGSGKYPQEKNQDLEFTNHLGGLIPDMVPGELFSIFIWK